MSEDHTEDTQVDAQVEPAEREETAAEGARPDEAAEAAPDGEAVAGDVPGDDAPPEEEPRALPEHPVLRALVEGFDEASWGTSAGQHVVFVPKERFREFAAAARDAGFEMCADLTAVDHLGRRRVRFEVVANLLSIEHDVRLRLRVEVGADDPRIASLVPVYPGTNFMEREVYDMFGIEFEDHPDMTRILMPDDWVGHPLRKDFGVGSVPIQFKGAPKAG